MSQLERVAYRGPDPWIASVKVTILDKELVNFEVSDDKDNHSINFLVLEEELKRQNLDLTPNTLIYIHVGEKIYRSAVGKITKVDDLIGFSIDILNIQVRQPGWLPEDDIDLSMELGDETDL